MIWYGIVMQLFASLCDNKTQSFESSHLT